VCRTVHLKRGVHHKTNKHKDHRLMMFLISTVIQASAAKIERSIQKLPGDLLELVHEIL
jgi:hypothetical protein